MLLGTRLELLHELVPKASIIGNPGQPGCCGCRTWDWGGDGGCTNTWSADSSPERQRRRCHRDRLRDSSRAGSQGALHQSQCFLHQPPRANYCTGGTVCGPCALWMARIRRQRGSCELRNQLSTHIGRLAPTPAGFSTARSPQICP